MQVRKMRRNPLLWSMLRVATFRQLGSYPRVSRYSKETGTRDALATVVSGKILRLLNVYCFPHHTRKRSRKTRPFGLDPNPCRNWWNSLAHLGRADLHFEHVAQGWNSKGPVGAAT